MLSFQLKWWLKWSHKHKHKLSFGLFWLAPMSIVWFSRKEQWNCSFNICVFLMFLILSGNILEVLDLMWLDLVTRTSVGILVENVVLRRFHTSEFGWNWKSRAGVKATLSIVFYLKYCYKKMFLKTTNRLLKSSELVKLPLTGIF